MREILNPSRRDSKKSLRKKDEDSEFIRSKIVITTPYEKGTIEYENFMENLQEMANDNNGELGIDECEICEECGEINETVHKVKVGKVIKKLCDYCIRTYEE